MRDERTEPIPKPGLSGRRPIVRLPNRPPKTAEVNPPEESSPGRQPAAAAIPRPTGTIAREASNDERTMSKRREGWRQSEHRENHHAQKEPGGKGRIKEDEADAIEPHPHGEGPVEVIPGRREQRRLTTPAAMVHTGAPARVHQGDGRRRIRNHGGASGSTIGEILDTATATQTRKTSRPNPAGSRKCFRPQPLYLSLRRFSNLFKPLRRRALPHCRVSGTTAAELRQSSREDDPTPPVSEIWIPARQP